MYHLDKAGFAFAVVTLSGNPVKFEFWAMHGEDTEIRNFHTKCREQLKTPLKLCEVVEKVLGQDSDYIGG